MDVVVPFKGSSDQLRQLGERLARLSLRDGDSVLIVDNTPGAAETATAVPVLRAATRPTPAYAGNRGAERGSADWLVFLDADTLPPPDLLDRYFEPEPRERTGLLGGGVIDEPAPPDASAIARYAHIRRGMSQQDTFDFGEWGYPKTANAACRRTAFEAVGGFREEIRAAEDADLTYRLREAGWEVERREQAAVVHESRETLRDFLRQQLIWGSGGQWISRKYPGSVPLISRPGWLRWAASTTIGGLVRAIRRRDRDAALMAVFRPVEALAWELGRLRSNERPER